MWQKLTACPYTLAYFAQIDYKQLNIKSHNSQ